MKRIQDVLTDVPRALRRKDASHVLRRGVKYVRGRLPQELWLRADVCVDPEGEATETIRLFEPEPIEVNYQGSNTLPHQLASYNRRIAPAEGKVYVFEDVSVIGSNPVVGLDGNYPDERYFSASWFGVPTSFFTHQVTEMKRGVPLSGHLKRFVGRSSPAEHMDSGFLLLTEWGVGFYHWFYEVLPKLRWYEELKRVTGSSPKIICHSPLKEYHVRSLELMGYGADAVVQHPNRRSEVGRLYLAPHPIRLRGHQTKGLPFQLKWVGERIKSNLAEGSSGFGNRVYISREDADRRRVVNEDELMEALSAFGFERYEPGRLSFEDQIRLFANADLVVGPHGKAFTNLIYADDCTVVELFPENGADETYFVASAELGLEYEFMECPTSNHAENIRARDQDLKVPVSELVEVVERQVRSS